MRLLAVVILAVAVGPPAAAADPPAGPVDLRQVLIGDSLDADKAARAGLDVSEMKPPRLKKEVTRKGVAWGRSAVKDGPSSAR